MPSVSISLGHDHLRMIREVQDRMNAPSFSEAAQWLLQRGYVAMVKQAGETAKAAQEAKA